MRAVFLAYSHADGRRAEAIAKLLERAGWSVWWDQTTTAGTRFDKAIEDAIAAAKCVVVLWSSTSVDSEWVRAEASEGKQRNVLVPVLIDDVVMPLEFRRIQALRLTDWRSADPGPELSRLVEAVTAIAGPPRPEVPGDISRSSSRDLYRDLRVPGTPRRSWWIPAVGALALVGLLLTAIIIRGRLTTERHSVLPAPDRSGHALSSPEGTKTDLAALLRLTTPDGERPLIETLYGRRFDLGSQRDRMILENIRKLIRTDDNQYGVALDVDTEKLVFGQAPLVCRDMDDLRVVLSNQLEIDTRGRELIIHMYGLRRTATYEGDPLLRQIIADFEGKIRTPFRKDRVQLNLKTMQREWVPLRLTSVDQVIEMIHEDLEIGIRMGIKPGPSSYDLSHIDPSFVPSAGYNII